MFNPSASRGLRLAAAVALLLAPLCGLRAADGPPDPDAVEVWQRMRAEVFGERPITRDTGVITLEAPARAQNAALVPISISTRLPDEDARRIGRLYLFIDANPSPLGATFTFGPRSPRADIETRVRVEDYTWMRAIAEMSDGSLYMDRRYIKAAGGCSAPAGASADFDAFRARARLKIDPSGETNGPVLAQLMIQHPNSSGLARDPLTRLFIPPYFVREIEVTYAGELVLSAQVDFTISENPNLRFYFLSDGTGELRVRALDTRDREVSATARVGM